MTKLYHLCKVPGKLAALHSLHTKYVSGDHSVRSDLIDLYERLHRLTTQLRRRVEASLRTLFAGGVDFSPRGQVYRDTIDFWGRLIKTRSGVSTGFTHLRRLARRLHLQHALQSSLNACWRGYLDARRVYRLYVKPKGVSWREFFLRSFLDAQVSDNRPGYRTRAQALASIRREERARRDGEACRAVRGRDNKSGVLSACVEGPDGSLITLESQREMVPAMAASNVRRQQQCLGTPSMCEPFISDFGYLASGLPA